MAIDIGAGATDRASALTTDKTLIDLNNPANDDGVLDTLELFFTSGYDGAGIKMGTFYTSGTARVSRDWETLGSVTAGSKQTFTGKSVDVQTDDLIGIYGTSGKLEAASSGGSGILSKTGDQFGAGAVEGFSWSSDYICSLYATGSTAGASIPIIDNYYNNMRP